MMRRRRWSVAALLGVAVLVLLATAQPSSAGTVLKGIDDPRAFWPSSTNGPARMAEIADSLNGEVVRADISWADAEPRRGHYDEAYLDRVRRTIQAAVDNGLSVVVNVNETPSWASDRALWGSPPKGYYSGRYYRFYPPSVANLEHFRTFALHLSGKLRGLVLGYECWCEPNLWAYLFPQKTRTDDVFAARRYLAMLRAFSQGIRTGDPGARVIAGATAALGRNDRYGTSPQRFATVLKKMGAADHFDVYSHHPYMPGGARNPAPEAPPPSPSLCVSLGNIDTLLKIFPTTPFYLTEYGYNTAYTLDFGLYVNQVQQAAYLQRAYRWAARFPQVKLLIWYLVRDWSPSGRSSDVRGIYTGLRTVTGARKRSWYAFAGGNSLTIVVPAEITRGSPLVVRGRLTSATAGPIEGQPLVVERFVRDVGWRSVATVKSGDGGYYHHRLWPSGTRTFRVVWRGVVRSTTAQVIVR